MNVQRIDKDALSLRDRIAVEVEQCTGFKHLDGSVEYPCISAKNEADRILAIIRHRLLEGSNGDFGVKFVYDEGGRAYMWYEQLAEFFKP